MFQLVQPFTVKFYRDLKGSVPFLDWFESLQDRIARAKIKVRLDRLERGHFGNYRSVGRGVYELKVNFGPGYRLYYGVYGKNIILLLCGGDKSSQNRDIQKAHDHWQLFEEVSKDEKKDKKTAS